MGARGSLRGSQPRGTAGRPRARSRFRLPRPSPAGTVAAACIAGLAVLALAPILPIDRIDVRPTRHVSPFEVLRESGLEGAPAFRASAAEARTRLGRLAAVRDATVEIALPGSVRITLVEREAAGRWIVGGEEWFVDADGWLFSSMDATAGPALRVLDERNRAAAAHIDPRLVEAGLRLAALAPGELRPDVTAPHVVMTAGPAGLVLRSGSGWEIRFGSPDRFAEKLALARRFLRENPDRRLDYLDVRSADHIVFSPN